MTALALAVREWAPTFSSIVGLIIVVIGWYVVNRQNNARARHAEVRGLADRALAAVEQAVSVASRQRDDTLDVTDAARPNAWQVIHAFNTLNRQLQLLDACGLAMRRSFGLYISLKVLFTGDDFQTAEFHPWARDDERWNTMAQVSADLAFSIEQTFMATFAKRRQG